MLASGLGLCAKVWVGLMMSLSYAVAFGQDGLLSRDDSNRSQFAGPKMKRVQSFGQPAESSQLPLPSSSLVPGPSSQLPARVYKNVPVQGVYLNGVNVVGLRNQTLRGVAVRFDEHGNILIDAPQYDVQLDSSFHPLLPDEIQGRTKQTAPWPGVKAGATGDALDLAAPRASTPSDEADAEMLPAKP
jgi:hypothetical protein